MPRGRSKPQKRELPPPLPPERRTVGQLVGESIRLYGSHFWRALALGVPVVVLNALAWSDEGDTPQTPDALYVVLASVLLMPASFVAASALATGSPVRSRNALGAYLIGILVFIPFPFLATIFILPGLVWLALFGLAVPAALVEGLGLRRALARGVELARVDFVHVLGGLATLALLVFLTQAVLFFVLREYAENTQRSAAALASLVVSPLLFLGAALLYVDQDARLGSRHVSGKERDAHVPDADEADREGSADTPRESRPPA
jgi:hypothetical protein